MNSVRFGGEMIGNDLMGTHILTVGSYEGHARSEHLYNNSWFTCSSYPYSKRFVPKKVV